ncbi:MAG TPA: metal-dependent hydrolase [Kofleriaceae bacterium]|nr:metal-dependent hydrolase [Kofleriaceae bacterium]
MIAPSPRRAAPPLEVRARRFRFDDVPTYWFDGDPWKTRFFDAFSSLLPIGERLFVDAVRRAAAELDDAALIDLARTFAAQEAVHGREHRRYNERLTALGHDLDAWDRSQRRTIDRIAALADVRIPLAITVAFEHVTAAMGEAILGHDLLAGADPEMKAFWSWHSAEEIEHKGAAFEVYEQAGGGPTLRRVVMAWCLFILGVRMSARFVRMLRREGVLLDRGVWRAGLRFLRGAPGAPGLVARLAPAFRAYFRRDFHPWQKDDYELVERWAAAEGSAT